MPDTKIWNPEAETVTMDYLWKSYLKPGFSTDDVKVQVQKTGIWKKKSVLFLNKTDDLDFSCVRLIKVWLISQLPLLHLSDAPFESHHHKNI